MVDQVATEEQLNTLFGQVAEAITGLPADRITVAWETYGQPAWTQGEDFISVLLTVQDDPYDKLKDVVYDTSDPEVAEEVGIYTTVIQSQWSVFGPNSWDIAMKLKYSLTREPIRNLMRPLRVYPIPAIPAPVKVPYAADGQWWSRTDIRCSFNVGNVRRNDVPYIEAVEVRLYNSKGLERTFVIEEPYDDA